MILWLNFFCKQPFCKVEFAIYKICKLGYFLRDLVHF